MTGGKEVEYRLIRSARKTVAIQINRTGEVTVRAPRQCPQSFIDAFITEKTPWIQRKLQEVRQREMERARDAADRESGKTDAPGGCLRPLTPAEEQVFRARAAEIFGRKVAYYAARMGVTYQRITIRDQKTRWGSCSSKGNLNFNWRLLLAPVPVLDYVIVHELAHRREMNHSKRFWDIVGETMPDYETHRRWLRDHGDSLMRKAVSDFI